MAAGRNGLGIRVLRVARTHIGHRPAFSTACRHLCCHIVVTKRRQRLRLLLFALRAGTGTRTGILAIWFIRNRPVAPDMHAVDMSNAIELELDVVRRIGGILPLLVHLDLHLVADVLYSRSERNRLDKGHKGAVGNLLSLLVALTVTAVILSCEVT